MYIYILFADTQMSQSQPSLSASGSTYHPSEEAYCDLMGEAANATYVNRDQCQKYIFLVLLLIQNYLKTFKTCEIHALVDEDSCDLIVVSNGAVGGEKRKAVVVSEEEVRSVEHDLKIFSSLKYHVRGFGRHLERIVKSANLDFVKGKVLMLKAVGMLGKES